MATTVTFDLLTSLTLELREEILDLWCAVNDAGGSVGFTVGSPRADVARALAAHEAEMAAGGAWFVPARDAAGALVGMAWWVTGTHPLFRHMATAKRLMTDPTRRGEGIGRALLEHLHEVVRDIPGVELLKIDYRSGSGLGDWYATFGYTEVGRTLGAVRLSETDRRSVVHLMRTVDGSPLPVDERR